VLLYLVHHADAVASDLDARRPLSEKGRAEVERVAAKAAANGAKPSVIWHSGKLRAKQTAEAFWQACNPLAELTATRDLQPDDQPQWMRDRLRREARDILIAGHFPYLPRLLALLVTGGEAGAVFPEHGVVALITDVVGETRREVWRV
jgi:phosphohistidine phosphatase